MDKGAPTVPMNTPTNPGAPSAASPFAVCSAPFDRTSLSFLDDVGKVRLTGDVEEDVGDSHHKCDDAQLAERQEAEQEGHGNGRNAHRTHDVGCQHDVQLSVPVHHRPDKQAKHEIRQVVQGAEDAHPSRRGMEHQRCDERQCHEGHLPSHGRDGLPTQEPMERRVMCYFCCGVQDSPPLRCKSSIEGSLTP